MMYLALNNNALCTAHRDVWQRLSMMVLTCLAALGFAGPADAANTGTTIQSIIGIAQDEQVSGSLVIGASADGDTDAIHYKLTGPAELEAVRSGATTSFAVDGEGSPAAWDTTTVPNGDYTLEVYTLVEGQVDGYRSVNFVIKNLTDKTQTNTIQKDASESEQVVASEEQTPYEPVDLATVFANYTGPAGAEGGKTAAQGDTDGDGDVDDADIAVHLSHYQADQAPPERNQPQDPVSPAEPTTQSTGIEPLSADFGTASTSYQAGSGQALPLTVTGETASNKDLLVLAWSVAESRMVSEFAFSISEGPWEVPAEKLALLPNGVNNIQLLSRVGNKVVSRVTRDIDFVPAPVPFEIAFVNAPSNYEPGSGEAITLSATGDLAEGADVLVLAWSDAQGGLVDAFAFSLSEGPWTIPASRLDLLPEGVVELQLITRDSARTKVTHRMTVAGVTPEPVVLPEISVPASTSFTAGETTDLAVTVTGTLPADHELVAVAWSIGQQRMVAEFAHALDSSNPVISAAALATLPEGENEVRLQIRENGQVVTQVTGQVLIQAPAEPILLEPEPSASFIGAPGSYTTGSGEAISFTVQDLPAGGDVLIIAWSDAIGGLVPGFGHSQNAEPWSIAASKMDMLPAGTVELQLIIRGGDTRPKFTHRLEVSGSTPPAEDPTAGGGTTNPTPGDDGTTDPTTDPSNDPTTDPTTDPSTDPTTDPTNDPTHDPTTDPTTDPTNDPTAGPGSEPQGSNTGFTVLTRSADTQVIYVSDTDGNDNNSGLSESSPVKTLDHAKTLIRSGKPDWLLLKAGDTWEGQALTGFDVAGQSPDNPAVIGVYGDGPRPMIIPPHDSHGIELTNNYINGVVIQGIHIYAATRDKHSGVYVNRDPEVDGINLRLSSSASQFCKRLVIEDCKITHFDTNIEVVDDWSRLQKDANNQPIPGLPGRMQVTIRRNIIQYASGGDSHSVGVYIEGSRDSVIEQNLLDHNGWAQFDSMDQRNKRSHNIYAQSYNGPITVRENFISRGAAHGLQLRAGGNIERNMFVRNALAFFTSYHDSKANYNVILESDDMDPDTPEDWRGMGIQGWDMEYFEVVGNVVARRAGTLTRPALECNAATLTVTGNKIYAWRDTNNNRSMELYGRGTKDGNISEEAFGGNEPPFVDPSRGVGDYAGKIGVGSTLEDFIRAASNRPRAQWVSEYAPESVNNYIRAGFELIPHD